MTFTLFLILAFATYRLSRAVAQDDITEGVRQWVLNHQWTFVYRLISCAQCVGFWLAFVVLAVWFAATDWPGTAEYVVLALGTAGFQSAMATVAHRLDTITE